MRAKNNRLVNLPMGPSFGSNSRLNIMILFDRRVRTGFNNPKMMSPASGVSKTDGATRDGKW